MFMDKINYTVTLDDCSDYVKYQLKIPRVRKYIMKAPLSLLKICVIVFIVFSLSSIPALWNYWQTLQTTQGLELSNLLSIIFHFTVLILSVSWPFILIMIVFYALFLSLYYFDLFHILSKKIYKLLEGGDLSVDLEIKDEGLCAYGKGRSSSVNWNGIIDIYDTGKIFLIFIADYQAVVVPKRAFGNEENAQEFFNFVSSKLADLKKSC